jgi:hypothetical protein
VLVLEALGRAVPTAVLGHDGRLRRLLRPFPAVPSFALDAIDFLQFDGASFVEVPYGRGPPLTADVVQIFTDRRLRDAQHGTAPTSPQVEQPIPVVEPQRVTQPASPKKLGCIDAAALVLAAAKAPMTSRELITAMAVQNLWTSPLPVHHPLRTF